MAAGAPSGAADAGAASAGAGAAAGGEPHPRISAARQRWETAAVLFPCRRVPAGTIVCWGPRRNPAKRFRWGEEEQGSEAQFSPSLGGNEAKRTLRRRVSPGRATYFLPAQKVGKDAHRGSASGSTWSQGRSMLTVGHPLRTPGLRGVKPVRRSNDRRPSSTRIPRTAAPGLLPTKLAALLRRLRAPNLGVQACGSAPLTAQAPKCHAIPGAPVGCNSRSIRMHKAAGRRGNLCSRESRTPEREGRTPTERGDTKGGAPPWAHFW